LSCFKLVGTTPCCARGEGWAGSLNHCRHEACTRTTIRFLGGASAQPLRVVRLQFTLPWGRLGSSTSTVCFVYFALIIQMPTKPKGEPMIPLVAMGWIHLAFVFILLNNHEICLKLKSGFRIICKFPTFQKHYTCIYSILVLRMQWNLRGLVAAKTFVVGETKSSFGLLW
jgi:hypothetical protein